MPIKIYYDTQVYKEVCTIKQAIACHVFQFVRLAFLIKRCHFNLELKQRTYANIFQFIRPQAQSMEINSSDESCHHIVIPTLPFSEIKQTSATLCSTNVAPDASREFPRAGCEAATQWEPSHRRHVGECMGCFALSNWFEISYELMNQENKLFSVHALFQVLFQMPTHINRIILLLQHWNKGKV